MNCAASSAFSPNPYVNTSWSSHHKYCRHPEERSDEGSAVVHLSRAAMAQTKPWLDQFFETSFSPLPSFAEN
jgi:hypothetical protein